MKPSYSRICPIICTLSRCTLMLLLMGQLGCGKQAVPQDTVTQFAPFDALLAGLYDGHTSCRELLKHGNLGIGTFDRLEGEMILLDGTVWQVKADGKVYQPPLDTKTPFATVSPFYPEQKILVDRPLNFADLQELLDRTIPNPNLFYGLRISGTFSLMRTRSVPAQQKPYPPLAEVARNQPVFTMDQVKGTLVGFYCPAYVKGVNVPGYHLHFITDNFRQGGHVLDFVIASGQAEIDRYPQLSLMLPETDEAFSRVDLSKDRSTDLENAER